MKFEPINNEHAVTACQFCVALGKPIGPATFHAIRSQEYKWARELPAMTLVGADDFGTAVIPPAAPRTKNGVIYGLLRPDGSAVWQLRFFSNIVEVVCSRYSRWDPTWKQAEEYFRNIMSVILDVEVDTRQFAYGLRVVDQFHSELPYNLDTVFARSELLPARVFKQTNDWNAHIGVLEEDSGSRVIEAIDVDADIQNIASADGAPRPVAVVTVDHKLSLQSVATKLPDLPRFDEGSFAVLAEQMKKLHLRNKATLDVLLVEEMKQRIKLKGAT